MRQKRKFGSVGTLGGNTQGDLAEFIYGKNAFS
jgi:hypothetical protein